MQTFFGIILGALLTVGLVYVHDVTAGNGATVSSRAIVNWDVAASDWGHVEAGVHTAWLKLQNGFERT